MMNNSTNSPKSQTRRIPAIQETHPSNQRTGNTAGPGYAAELLFSENRRGSNGVIPGQYVPANYPLPQFQRHGEPLPTSHQQDDPQRYIKRNGSIRKSKSKIHDDPSVIAAYNSIPVISLDRLPRGGISLDTKAVGRIQFGIPPETIKDSMRLGFEVPSVYIVPSERFCREMGPALGLNLAEFEFPAFFNYFVRNKRCTLVVDSFEAEEDLRQVFGEVFLGPEQFRNHEYPVENADEDFDPSFPREARPNFYKEFHHFRTAEAATNYEEHTIDTLVAFCHFKGAQQGGEKGETAHEKLGIPPPNYVVPKMEPTTGVTRSLTAAQKKSAMEAMDDSMHLPATDLMTNASECAMDGDNSMRRSLSDPDLRKANGNTVPPPSPSLGPKMIDAAATPPLLSEISSGEAVLSATSSNLTNRIPRRSSAASTCSFLSKRSRDGMSWASGASLMLTSDDEQDPNQHTWTYSQAKWLGEVATIYPHDATAGQREENSCPRVEIFKMTGGTEYIVHDINEDNIIVGKAKFSGTVRVPDEIAVEGFLAREPDFDCDEHADEDDADDDDEGSIHPSVKSHDGLQTVAPPTFHPPSFGVTVLGNSHGFDKKGSVSGYVLWINGRGVMIDPPPYSSATLEREGIRPQMIMAIIITHCHADHDAGTFQKVMTGSRVAIITTPTIYKSFIRKYAALSGLSPTLLRHSHRLRPAVIGKPLKFQGAIFNFTYTLHTIPCIAFRVEWRGRSMVFTGDHLNSPPILSELQAKGVLRKERVDDLLHLPLQDCDILLHEAGAPPIHTPLSVLNALPDEVKERLYVVHTSALPPDSELRVAPTGTAGTIRLDECEPRNAELRLPGAPLAAAGLPPVLRSSLNGTKSHHGANGSDNRGSLGDDSIYNHTRDYFGGSNSDIWLRDSNTNAATRRRRGFELAEPPPQVFLRPTCVSDAWFILNLLSNVPFLSSLSYANTMEVLEIAQVELFCADEIVIPAERRSQVLCVVWEGTCLERDAVKPDVDVTLEKADTANMTELELDQVVYLKQDENIRANNPTVWHAGDWTGPRALQPEQERSAEPYDSDSLKDVVALSTQGVKVIILNMKNLHHILRTGSKLFRKYLTLKEKQAAKEDAMKAEMIRNETELGSIGYDNEAITPAATADSIIEEASPASQWYAYDSVVELLKCNSTLGMLTALQKRHLESLAEGPRLFDSGHCLWSVGENVDYAFLIVDGTAKFQPTCDDDLTNRRCSTGDMSPARAASARRAESNRMQVYEDKQLLKVPPNSEFAKLEIILQLRLEEMELDLYEQGRELLPKEERMRNARDRFANKVLARLYARQAYTDGLVFSRGHLLSDTSRMVSGNLAHIHQGRQGSMGSISHGLTGEHHCHTSNMTAGPDGCVVMVFPRSSLVQFLDGNPGVLLSLLGTQVVV